MTVYTVALAKGGSTKTTTAAELVHALAARGRRVLALDLDQQGNLTTRCGLSRAAEVTAVAADVMEGKAAAEEAAVEAPSVPGAHIIAGTQHMAAIEHMPEAGAALRDYLPTLTRWDDVVIDTPPALGVVTLAALAAANVVIAPVACETEAYEQLDRLDRFVAQKVARLRPGQQIHAIIPTRYDGRRLLDREVVGRLTERHPGKVSHPVREAVAARDSYTAGQPASAYAPRSGVATDYAQALAPILDPARAAHRADMAGQPARPPADNTEQTPSNREDSRV